MLYVAYDDMFAAKIDLVDSEVRVLDTCDIVPLISTPSLTNIIQRYSM